MIETTIGIGDTSEIGSIPRMATGKNKEAWKTESICVGQTIQSFGLELHTDFSTG